MSLVLEGTLADVGLCDLLRLIARERRSGALHVTIDGCRFHFTLDDGRLTGVRGDEVPEPSALEPTIRMLVRYRRGAFRLEPSGAGDLDGEVDASAVGIDAELLAAAGEEELARMEARLAQAGGEGAKPARDAFPKPKQLEALAADSRAVFALVNGERSFAELFARSRLDPLRVLDALDALVAESLVRRPAVRPGEAPAPDRSVALASGAWRNGLAAILPVGMLFVFLAFSGGSSASGGSDPFAIPRDPLAAARAAREVERLRGALQAHHFVEGHFPERLRTLVQAGYLPVSALTDARGRPYYYARRGDEFVLLAPER